MVGRRAIRADLATEVAEHPASRNLVEAIRALPRRGSKAWGGANDPLLALALAAFERGALAPSLATALVRSGAGARQSRSLIGARQSRNTLTDNSGAAFAAPRGLPPTTGPAA